MFPLYESIQVNIWRQQKSNKNSQQAFLRLIYIQHDLDAAIVQILTFVGQLCHTLSNFLSNFRFQHSPPTVADFLCTTGYCFGERHVKVGHPVQGSNQSWKKGSSSKRSVGSLNACWAGPCSSTLFLICIHFMRIENMIKNSWMTVFITLAI